jgi:hypothetical protein
VRHAFGFPVIGDDDEVLLLLDVEREILGNIEPQLVAQTIAAYTANNKVRAASLDLPPLADATLPAILMQGTVPTSCHGRALRRCSTRSVSGIRNARSAVCACAPEPA